MLCQCHWSAIAESARAWDATNVAIICLTDLLSYTICVLVVFLSCSNVTSIQKGDELQVRTDWYVWFHAAQVWYFSQVDWISYQLFQNSIEQHIVAFISIGWFVFCLFTISVLAYLVQINESLGKSKSESSIWTVQSQYAPLTLILGIRCLFERPIKKGWRMDKDMENIHAEAFLGGTCYE